MFVFAPRARGAASPQNGPPSCPPTSRRLPAATTTTSFAGSRAAKTSYESQKSHEISARSHKKCRLARLHRSRRSDDERSPADEAAIKCCGTSPSRGSAATGGTTNRSADPARRDAAATRRARGGGGDRRKRGTAIRRRSRILSRIASVPRRTLKEDAARIPTPQKPSETVSVSSRRAVFVSRRARAGAGPRRGPVRPRDRSGVPQARPLGLRRGSHAAKDVAEQLRRLDRRGRAAGLRRLRRRRLETVEGHLRGRRRRPAELHAE